MCAAPATRDDVAKVRVVPSRRAAWIVAGVATLVMTVSYVDRQTLAAIAPTVRGALGIDPEQYGWLTSAFSMAYLIGAPLAGGIVDRVGARRGLVASVLAWSFVSALHAIAPSFAALFVLRIALGATEAPSFPGAAQTVRRILPPGDRSAGFGLLFTGSSIGSMIAPTIAIGLNEAFGWRGAFLGTALVGLVWIPAWLAVTRRSHVGAALDQGAIALDAAPTSRAALLATPAVLRAVVLVVTSAASIMFVLNWYPQYLVDAHHLTQRDLARYVWMPPVFFDLGAVAFGAVASRRDRRGKGAVRTHWPLVVVAAALSATLVVVPALGGPWGAVLVASASMAGGGGLYALLTADMLARVPPRHVSTAGGLTAAAQSLTYVVANPIIGRIIRLTHDYDGVIRVLALLVVPGAIAWSAWPMGRSSSEAPAPSSAR